jgi:uncharacterized protein YegJ (DUF2314 family)
MNDMRKLLLLLLCVEVAGCQRQAEADKAEDKDKVVYVKSEDPAMAAAIVKAQDTLINFKNALVKPPPNSSRFAVKVGFPYGTKNDREHIWLKDPTFSGETVTGQVINQPVDVTELKLGQTVTAPVKNVSDWMFVQGQAMHGGFTMRVLLDKMAPEEREKMLKDLGVKL